MNRMRPVFRRMILGVVFLTAAVGVLHRSASAVEAPPSKVAILPFNLHAPSNLAYLQDGIRDMLASRIAWQGRVDVIDRTAVNQAVQGSKGDLSMADSLRIGKALKADHVLFGSITALGQSISIDAKMAPVSGSAEPLAFFAQTSTLDEVIPRITQFSQQINQKVFSRPSEASQTASVDSEALSTRNPELLVPESMVGGDRLSYLNPNFVEVTSEGSLRQPGLWRSQTFKGAMAGMDVGDLDGDKRLEMVTITNDKVTVYRREAQGLKTIATYSGGKVDRFLWVSVVDVNRDGRGEIYVTNLRKRNYARPGRTDESVQGDLGFAEELGSFGLALNNGQLQVICKDLPYFLNGVDMTRRGKVLLGQEKAPQTEGAFKPDIYEMMTTGGTLRPSTPVPLPSRCNVFNFARADINNDHSDETIVIDNLNRLLVLSATGDQIWKSDKMFAATTNMFEGRVEDRRYNSVDLYAIPSPILVADVNKDDIPEIVVTRSLDVLGKFMPNSLKFFDRGEIVSLSWDQLGIVENWKTREISGMVTSIRIGDLNGDGVPELIASLVLAKDFLKLWDSQSTIFSYDLNVSGPRKPDKGK